MAGFVHLRVKSAYSLLEGAVRPKELAKLARGMGMPAVAVTDTNNLFGVYEIADTLAKAGRPAHRRRAAVGRAAGSARRTNRAARKKPPHLAAAGAERGWAIAISPSCSAPPIWRPNRATGRM